MLCWAVGGRGAPSPRVVVARLIMQQEASGTAVGLAAEIGGVSGESDGPALGKRLTPQRGAGEGEGELIRYLKHAGGWQVGSDVESRRDVESAQVGPGNGLSTVFGRKDAARYVATTSITPSPDPPRGGSPRKVELRSVVVASAHAQTRTGFNLFPTTPG